MTLDEFTAEVFERVSAERQLIRHPEGDVHPALFLQAAGSLVRQTIPRSWFDSRGRKDRLTSLIATAVLRGRPSYVAFVHTIVYNEVDADTLTPEQREAIMENRIPEGIVAPLQNPEAKERLQVVIFSPETTVAYGSEITRDHRNPPAFGPWEDFGAPSGLMVEPIERAMRRLQTR